MLQTVQYSETMQQCESEFMILLWFGLAFWVCWLNTVCGLTVFFLHFSLMGGRWQETCFHSQVAFPAQFPALLVLLCRPAFTSGIIFLLSERLHLIFLLIWFFGWWILSTFYLPPESLYSALIFETHFCSTALILALFLTPNPRYFVSLSLCTYSVFCLWFS